MRLIQPYPSRTVHHVYAYIWKSNTVFVLMMSFLKQQNEQKNPQTNKKTATFAQWFVN